MVLARINFALEHLEELLDPLERDHEWLAYQISEGPSLFELQKVKQNLFKVRKRNCFVFLILRSIHYQLLDLSDLYVLINIQLIHQFVAIRCAHLEGLQF